MFRCGKTGTQELHQCGNDVNRYSYLATILIQFIFCVYRDMWEEQVKMYLCACYLYACVFVGVYCCDKTNALWFKGEEKNPASALHHFGEHLEHYSVTSNLGFHA